MSDAVLRQAIDFLHNAKYFRDGDRLDIIFEQQFKARLLQFRAPLWRPVEGSLFFGLPVGTTEIEAAALFSHWCQLQPRKARPVIKRRRCSEQKPTPGLSAPVFGNHTFASVEEISRTTKFLSVRKLVIELVSWTLHSVEWLPFSAVSMWC